MILLKIRTFSAFFTLSFSSHVPFLTPPSSRTPLSSKQFGTVVIKNDIDPDGTSGVLRTFSPSLLSHISPYI
ncbi:hypothetical protein CJJ19_03380 [Candidatus Williamhamiltonella defendens]|nr:hypothetical protein CJJ19_03380 [Candidatus Hamiltonella defensa]